MGAIGREQESFPLYNGRPPKNSAFDVRLFHPAFEKFSQRFHGTGKLAKEGNAAVHELLVLSANYYDTKNERREAIKPVLKTLLGGRDLEDTENLDRSSPDGTIFYSSGRIRGSVALLLFELKNEIGTGYSDATHQVGLLYRKYWVQKVTQTDSRDGNSLTGSLGHHQSKLLPHIPTNSNGIVVVRARRGVHRPACRSTPDSAVVVGPHARTQATVPGGHQALLSAVNGHQRAGRLLLSPGLHGHF